MNHLRCAYDLRNKVCNIQVKHNKLLSYFVEIKCQLDATEVFYLQILLLA